MADIDFVNYLIQASGAAGRSELTGPPSCHAHMPGRLLDIINVKDFGATGNGSTDDRANIQAALDAAFKTSGSSNGQPNGSCKNRMVFFPPGHYIITSALNLRGVYGSRIVGSGQNTTIIENTTLATDGGDALASAVEAADCINAQSYAFCTIEHLTLKARSNTGHDGFGPACFRMRSGAELAGPCQSNSFYNVTFDGGQIGLSLAEGHTSGTSDPYMCSETMVMGCTFKNQTATDYYFIDFAGAGIHTGGNNACDETIIGSYFENCFLGLYIPSGSFNLIEGVVFNNGTSNKFDIWVEGGARDSFCVRGCRSSSQNFIHTEKGCWSITDCIHDCSVNGTFMFANGIEVVIRGCLSTKGEFEAKLDQSALISGCTFGRSDWLNFVPGTYHANARIELENIVYNSATPTQIVRQRTRAPSGSRIDEQYDVT